MVRRMGRIIKTLEKEDEDEEGEIEVIKRTFY